MVTLVNGCASARSESDAVTARLAATTQARGTSGECRSCFTKSSVIASLLRRPLGFSDAAPTRVQIRKPAEHAPFGDADCRCEHKNKGDDQDHPHPDAVDIERAGSIQDVESKPRFGRYELANECADHRKNDAGLETVEDVGGDRRNDNVAEDLAAICAHDAGLVDEVRLDLLHAGEHRVEHQEKYH